jgi:hypothetical protein
MLRANGHNPTPRISPISVLVRLNSAPQVEINMALSINMKDVAINAVKQAQNNASAAFLSVVDVFMAEPD